MRNIFTVELLQRPRRLSTYIYAVVFFGFTVVLISAAGGAFKGANVSVGVGEKVLINSPYSLATFIGLLSFFGLPVQQDFEYEVHPFFFTAPITKLQYLGGRFLAGAALLLLIFAAIPVGALFASHAPWIDASRVGRNQAMAYIGPCLFIVLPNLLFTGAVFFIMAALLRKILPVFLTAVITLVGYFIGLQLASQLENKTVAALVDPFGTLALGRLTEYWTIAERNGRPIPLEGVFLANRLLWMAVAIAVFVIAYHRFRFTHVAERGARAR